MQLFANLKKFLCSGFRATLNFRKFKVALKPLRRNFFKFARSCILTCQSLFNNKKWGSPDSFLSYKHLKGKLRVFLTGKTVAILTNDIMKMTTTYSAMIGHLFDIIISAAELIKICSTDPSKFKSLKLLETVVSLLKPVKLFIAKQEQLVKTKERYSCPQSLWGLCMSNVWSWGHVI